jgi:hypothetical protein
LRPGVAGSAAEVAVVEEDWEEGTEAMGAETEAEADGCVMEKSSFGTLAFRLGVLGSEEEEAVGVVEAEEVATEPNMDGCVMERSSFGTSAFRLGVLGSEGEDVVGVLGEEEAGVLGEEVVGEEDAAEAATKILVEEIAPGRTFLPVGVPGSEALLGDVCMEDRASRGNPLRPGRTAEGTGDMSSFGRFLRPGVPGLELPS